MREISKLEKEVLKKAIEMFNNSVKKFGSFKLTDYKMDLSDLKESLVPDPDGKIAELEKWTNELYKTLSLTYEVLVSGDNCLNIRDMHLIYTESECEESQVV